MKSSRSHYIFFTFWQFLWLVFPHIFPLPGCTLLFLLFLLIRSIDNSVVQSRCISVSHSCLWLFTFVNPRKAAVEETRYINAECYYYYALLLTVSDYCCRLLALSQQTLTDTSLPDELLFGRSGYLMGLLFVRHHLGMEAVPQTVIQQVTIAACQDSELLTP